MKHKTPSVFTHLAAVVLCYYSLGAQACALRLYTCTVQGVRFGVITLNENISKSSEMVADMLSRLLT